jgi:hypothetical protein
MYLYLVIGYIVKLKLSKLLYLCCSQYLRAGGKCPILTLCCHRLMVQEEKKDFVEGMN